ncbi:MAG: protein TolQ [Rhodospirillaceae bacterium]
MSALAGFDLISDAQAQTAPPLPDAAPTTPVQGEGLAPPPPPSPGGGVAPAGAGAGAAGAAGFGPGAAAAGAAGHGGHSMSLMSLFWQADWVVKAVMIGLALASVWCWAIIFEKIFKLRNLAKRASKFEEKFWSGNSLDDLYDRMGSRPADPMSAIFAAAMREWRQSAGRRSGGSGPKLGVGQRIERVMDVTLDREMESIERRLGVLATTGSTAPFVGLFGTVWGIMNSFYAIGLTNDTSLATVAPGMAEALFATALGLIAAIPAVVAYNKLSNDVDRYAARLEGFSSEFSAILSRQLEGND